MDKKIVITIWESCFGQRVRCPSGNDYICSKQGEMEVSEEDARELCTTAGWRLKPQLIKKVPLESKTPKPSETAKNVENKSK